MIESIASNVNVKSEVSVAVARKALDQMDQQGEAAIKLIQAAANMSDAVRGDVAPKPGPQETGQRLDVTA